MKRLLSIILLLVCTVSLMQSPLYAQEPLQSLTYEVTRSNEATNTWYNADYTEMVHYSVPNNSYIEVSLINGSVSSISIGNITRDAQDDEIEENLALGYWQLKGLFGIFANTSWDLIEKDFNEVEFSSKVMASGSREILDGTREEMIITFEDDNQKTNLSYDKETGVLFEASSNVFGFDLAFILVEINSSSDYYYAIAFLTFPIPAFLILLPLPLLRKLRKNGVKSSDE